MQQPFHISKGLLLVCGREAARKRLTEQQPYINSIGLTLVCGREAARKKQAEHSTPQEFNIINIGKR
jgi:hypothetical protein